MNPITNEEIALYGEYVRSLSKGLKVVYKQDKPDDSGKSEVITTIDPILDFIDDLKSGSFHCEVEEDTEFTEKDIRLHQMLFKKKHGEIYFLAHTYSRDGVRFSLSSIKTTTYRSLAEEYMYSVDDRHITGLSELSWNFCVKKSITSRVISYSDLNPLPSPLARKMATRQYDDEDDL
jgi:hypothetical protein